MSKGGIDWLTFGFSSKRVHATVKHRFADQYMYTACGLMATKEVWHRNEDLPRCKNCERSLRR